MTIVGTLEQVCSLWNLHGLADFVIGLQHVEDRVVTVFKVPNEKVPAVWRKLGRDPLTCPVQ